MNPSTLRRRRSVCGELLVLPVTFTSLPNPGSISLSGSKGTYYLVRYDPQELTESFLACSVNKIAPKPRKILQLLRLLQINNGIFIKVNRATEQMLKLVEPYITYG